LIGVPAQSHRTFQNLGDKFLDQILSSLPRRRIDETALFYDLIEKTRFSCRLFNYGRTTG